MWQTAMEMWRTDPWTMLFLTTGLSALGGIVVALWDLFRQMHRLRRVREAMERKAVQREGQQQ